MIRALAFDLDGTLIDSTEAILASFFHLFDTIGEARPSREQILENIGAPLPEELKDLTQHDPDDCERIYRAHYNEIACAQTTLLPGVEVMLQALHAQGIPIGFATSKKLPSATMVLDHLGVLDYFDCRLGPDEVAQPKPHPAAALEAARQLGVAPENLAFVGDMHFDIVSAQEAGAIAVAVATGYESRPSLEALKPHAVFDSMHEVLTWVQPQLEAPERPQTSQLV